VREWIDAKLDAQLAFLAELKRTRAKEAEWIGARIDRITAVRDRLGTLALESSDELRGTLMGYEGTAGRMYFSVIARLLPERYAFHGRRARPARDSFNACLNYGYGMLYAHVEKACILAGLDPHVGILHADRYNKRSMVFDLIEPFRPYVDQPIFYLFSRRRVTEEHVEQDSDEVRLQDAGRKLVVEAVNTHLDAAVRYRGRNLKRENVILASAHQAANRLLDLFGDPDEELPPPEVDLPDAADLGDDDPDVFSDSLDEDTDADLGPL
jgi:CRISPR-associated protein Cas1